MGKAISKCAVYEGKPCDCGKPLVNHPPEVYGYLVYCTFRKDDGTTETRTYKSKGSSRTKAHRTPIFKKGLESVDRLDPYTKEQWLRALGEGRM